MPNTHTFTGDPKFDYESPSVMELEIELEQCLAASAGVENPREDEMEDW